VSGNTDYQKVKLVTVEWDVYKNDPISSKLRVTRQSTMVMFNKGTEVARTVSATSKADIAPLFNAALAK
jgi:hypothetical protein